MAAAKKVIHNIKPDLVSAVSVPPPELAEQPSPAVAPAARVVEIRSTGAIRVITESIREDGRERHENGSVVLAANETGTFLVGPLQSQRIVVQADAK